MLEFLGELSKEEWGAIGLVGGACIASLSNFFSSKMQERIAIFRAKTDVRIHREKIEADLKIALAEKTIEKLEFAHEILSEVSMSFSLTGMYFTSEDQPVEEFRGWYISYCRKVEKISGILAFYVPGSSDDVKKLYGKMNVYWGEMEGIMVTRSRGESEFVQARRQEAYVVSLEILKIVASIIFLLEKKATETLNAFSGSYR